MGQYSFKGSALRMEPHVPLIFWWNTSQCTASWCIMVGEYFRVQYITKCNVFWEGFLVMSICHIYLLFGMHNDVRIWHTHTHIEKSVSSNQIVCWWIRRLIPVFVPRSYHSNYVYIRRSSEENLVNFLAGKKVIIIQLFASCPIKYFLQANPLDYFAIQHKCCSQLFLLCLYIMQMS